MQNIFCTFKYFKLLENIGNVIMKGYYKDHVSDNDIFSLNFRFICLTFNEVDLIYCLTKDHLKIF